MNGKVYIAGGRQGQEALNTCEVYNPVTNEWQLIPSLKVPRMSASMVCHEGRLYVLGGVIPSTGRCHLYYQLKHLILSKMNGKRDQLYQLIALKQVRKRNRRIYLKLVLQNFAKR